MNTLPLLYAQETLETLSSLHQSFVRYLPNLLGFGWCWSSARQLPGCSRVGPAHQRKDGPATCRRTKRLGRVDARRGHRPHASTNCRQVVFWLLMALTLMLAIKQLNIQDFDTTIQQILAFFPRLIVSLLILVLGLLLGKFLRGVIATGADRMGLNYAQTLANVVYFAFVIVLLHQISRQLGLELELFTY